MVVVASPGPATFSALHVYTAPLSPLIRFVRLSVLVVESTLLFPFLVQVMLGVGLPVALQNRVVPFPSFTGSGDGAVTIGGSMKENQTYIVYYEVKQPCI